MQQFDRYTGTCRADTGGSALPACSLLARECPASVTPGASVVIVPDQTSWCRWRLIQQRLTLVVACLLLSSEPRRGLHCNNRHATSRRRERVSPPNQRQAKWHCWVERKSLLVFHCNYLYIVPFLRYSASMFRRLSTRNVSSKSMHAFLGNLANRQTDRQTQAKTFTSSFVGGNMPKFGRKVPHLWCDSHTSFKVKVKSSKVKVTKPINDDTHRAPYILNGKTYELQTWYKDGGRRPASATGAMAFKVKDHGRKVTWSVRAVLTQCCTFVIRSRPGHTVSAEPGDHTSCKLVVENASSFSCRCKYRVAHKKSPTLQWCSTTQQ